MFFPDIVIALTVSVKVYTIIELNYEEMGGL